MATSTTSPPAPPSRRHLLGLRKKPGRLALALFRTPLRPARSGHLPAGTFVTFVHVGRRTGRPHEAVAMVLRYDEATREVVIFAAWGPDTDWVRNLRARPAARVQLGKESFVPQQRFLSDDEAFDVVRDFCRRHPWRLRIARAVLGWDDLRDEDAVRAFVQMHPFVALRPAPPATRQPVPPRLDP
jgi:deazaflavin-dependent oxidoreductase (nitroreductase family)